MKRIVLFVLLLSAVTVLKAQTYADENIAYTNLWNSTVAIQVKTAGGLSAGAAALEAAQAYEMSNLAAATTVNLTGNPNSDDFSTLKSICPALQTLNAEALSSLPDGVSFASTMTVLIAPKGSDLSASRFDGIPYVRSTATADAGDVTIRMNEAGDFATYRANDTGWNLWATTALTLIGPINLDDVKAMQEVPAQTLNISQVSGIRAAMVQSSGFKGSWKLFIMPNGAMMPGDPASLFANSSWQTSTLVIRQGDVICIWWNGQGTPTLTFADDFLAGATQYMDYSGNLTADAKAFLEGKGLTQTEKTEPFSGEVATVDLTDKALEAVIGPMYGPIGKDAKTTMKRLIVTGGSLAGYDLSAYTALESITVPSKEALPATLPASIHYLYIKDKAIKVVQAGALQQAILENGEVLSFAELSLSGTLNGADLDLGTRGFNPATLRYLNLSEATLSSASDLKLPVDWQNTSAKISVLLPNGTTNFGDFTADYSSTVHLSSLVSHTGEATQVFVVGAFDSHFVGEGKPLVVSVKDNSTMTVINTISALGSINVPKIDLSNVTLPANTNVSIANNNLKGGVDLGTQSVYGNYTLSASHEEFTSYTLKSHISGNVDLSGSIYLASLDLTQATIDGTISLPNASTLTATVSSETMKQKLIAAGMLEGNITLDTSAKGTVSERGNYVIVNYDASTTDFAAMLDQAVTIANGTKRIVVHATGGIKQADLDAWKAKDVDAYFDFYDIAGTDEEKTAAIMGLKTFIAAIKAGTYRKPLGIVLPKDVTDEALTADQVAAACVEFGGRYRSGVSIMYVNEGPGSTQEEKSQASKEYFNHGADITMMHSDLRSSFIYLVGTALNEFVQTSERIPEESMVTLLKVCEVDGRRNMEVTVHRSGELNSIVMAANRLTSGAEMGNLVIKTGHGTSLNDADIEAQSLLTVVESLNVLDADMPENATLKNSHYKYIVMRKGSADISEIESQLKGWAQIVEGDGLTQIKGTTAQDIEKIFSLIENEQTDKIKNIQIEGQMNNSTLQKTLNMDAVELIDLSEVTLTEGTNIQSLISSNKEWNDRVAFILPANTPKSALSDFQYTGDYSRLMTFGYYTDDTKAQLNLWATTSSKALSHYNAVLDGTQSVAFLPRYSSDGSLVEGPYMDWNDDIRDQVKLLNAKHIDFNWVNISALGQDFAWLNPTVRHITLPTATQNRAGGEYSGFDEYTYPAGLLSVSTYKNMAAPYSDNCSYGGAKYVATRPTTITLLRSEGALAEAYSLMSADLKASERLNLIGNIACEDLGATALFADAVQVDLHMGTLVAGTTLSSCLASNATVQYLALPDNTNDQLTATDADSFAFEGLAGLKAVGVYNTVENKYYVHSTEAGSVGFVTEMVKPNTLSDRNSRSGQYADGLNNVRLSGYLNLQDISTVTTVAHAGLDNATIKHADLSLAVFPTQTDMAFNGSADAAGEKSIDPTTNAAWGSLETILLPTDKRMDTLPAYSLENIKATYICLPGNFKHIEQYSLYDNNQLLTITTTATDAQGNGTGEELCYNSQGENVDLGELAVENYPHTVTLPAALESIKTGAFQLDEQYTDVYVLSVGHVPTCEANAFGEGTYFGWGGFNSASPITRASYQNGATKPFAILHWPAGIPAADVEKYTDVTRRYSIYDELQNVDGDGNVLVWPNQTEYYHAYITATYGYLWGAYDKEASSQMSGYQTTQDQVNAANPSTDPQYQYDPAYTGWHQFVLTGSVLYLTPRTSYLYYQELDWYSMCLPFDVTYSMLMQICGVKRPADGTIITVRHTDAADAELTSASESDVYPRVSTLMGVRRSTNDKMITLQFTQNLAQLAGEGKKSQWSLADEDYVEADLQDGDPIVMKAGYPYLIKPYVPATETAPFVTDFRAYIKQMYVALGGANNITEGEAKLPFQEWKVKARKDNGEVAKKDGADYYYLFLGTYNPLPAIPEWSYFLASNGSHNVWYKHKWGASWTSPWIANSALIAPMGTIAFEDLTKQSAAERTSYSMTVTAYDDPLFDDHGNPIQAPFRMVFDEGSTTGISSPVDNGQWAVGHSDNAIYTLDGRKVANQTPLTSEGVGRTALPKGIYIQNGRKFIVR